MTHHLSTVARTHLRVATGVLALLLLAACGSADAAGTGAAGGGAGPDAASSAGPLDGGSRTEAPVVGRVTDASGTPVVGALVDAVSLDEPQQPVPERAVLTDSDGRYDWYGLAPGRYRLQVSAGGRSAAGETSTPPGGSVELDLVVR